MPSLKKLNRIPAFFTLFFIFCLAVKAAPGDVDTGFMATLTRVPDGALEKVIIQPDGKILVAGLFSAANERGRNGIARYNPDGTLDTTFNPPVFGHPQSFLIKTIKLLPDGKIYVGGGFSYVDGFYRGGLVRLNPDGSPDHSFTIIRMFGAEMFFSVLDIDVFPDGKVMAVGDFSFSTSPTTYNRRIKFNSDGSIDTTYQQSSANETIHSVAIQPDGKILLGSRYLRRLNADGTVDTSFSVPDFVNGEAIKEIVVLPDGQIMVGGSFATINGFSGFNNLARFNADGTIDPSFNNNKNGPNNAVFSLVRLPDGRFLIGGVFTTYNSVAKHRAALIGEDGELDTSFDPPQGIFNSVNSVARQADGKILLAGWNTNPTGRLLMRLNADGSLDNTFLTSIGMHSRAFKILVQPDGKILVGGNYKQANGVIKNSLARFNADGTLDTSFNQTIFGELQIIDGLDLQADGKIIVATQSGGQAGGTHRLNADGSWDLRFPSSDVSFDTKVLADGKILIATGRFLRRYNSDGSLDATLATGNDSIYNIELQPDGKILVSGVFNSINSVNRGRIARLNGDGTVDTSFNPPGGANANINDIDLQADGKILIAGDFTGVNFTERFYIARLNADGSLDNSFNAGTNSPLLTVKQQPDGKILIGGSFDRVNGEIRRGYARLTANGAIDSVFNQGYGANNAVRDIELDQNNKILLGGDFFNINGVGVLGLARLDNSLAVARTRFDFDGDGRADIGVFRPSSSVWYQLLGVNYQFAATNFGTGGDIITPADFDGDGRADLGIFRPSTGTFWYAASSAGGAFRAVQWGANGDIPLPSDFNGDGKDDFVVFRPSNSTWYRLTDTGVSSQLTFGTAGDKPLVGDFDGDGKADYAVFRPSTGTFWYAASSAGNEFRATQWGIAEDVPVPADYDGDGKTDFAVFRPSNGVWYILNSGNQTATIIQFGLSADKPVAADYDGDGKADIAVYRPSTGEWYMLRTTAGFFGLQFGINEDVPIPNAFVP